MRFTDSLWKSAEEIYARILAHPFLSGLIDGSLPEESFRFYVVQDALYLRDFARGLALLAAKAPEDRWVTLFSTHARSTFEVERALHEQFFARWKLTPEQVYATPPAPNTVLYTAYLLRIAQERPFHEGLGAFLPCYWVYGEVGKTLERAGSSSTLYQQWIDTYAGDEFAAAVREVLDVMDALAPGLGESQKRAVRHHFLMTCRFEYLFWEMGYRRQDWPV
jgi:thiaminase/transcriptional activator TenA